RLHDVGRLHPWRHSVRGRGGGRDPAHGRRRPTRCDRGCDARRFVDGAVDDGDGQLAGPTREVPRRAPRQATDREVNGARSPARTPTDGRSRRYRPIPPGRDWRRTGRRPDVTAEALGRVRTRSANPKTSHNQPTTTRGPGGRAPG